MPTADPQLPHEARLGALRVDDPASGALLECDLGADPRDSLRTTRLHDGPVVFLVRNTVIDELSIHEDLIVDRKHKHPAKPLAAILLGRRRIPVVRGSYSEPGQVVRSVKALLRRAAEQGDDNVFLVGTDDEVFERLRRRAEGGATARAPARRQRSRRPQLWELLVKLPEPPDLVGDFVGRSDEAQLVRQLVLRAARQDDPVVVLGDTGTGKEVVARQIHAQSMRRKQAFVPVNCGAIPTELFESELFGYEPGSHSRAERRKPGLWSVASDGTLFLDEIDDLDQSHQVKILRALQEGTIRPIGATAEKKVNARVVAAANRDLYAMVRRREFAEDLYYRLRGFMIRTPALRDHADDIPLLADHFWRKITGDHRASLPPEILCELRALRWPGNARELRAVLSSLFALFGRDKLSRAHLDAVLEFEGNAHSEPTDAAGVHRVESLRHLHRVADALQACRHTLRPLVLESRIDTAVLGHVVARLRRSLAEIGLLCRRPLLFNNPESFEAVEALHDRLLEFGAQVDADVEAARRTWDRELDVELREASRAIFAEAQRLLAGE